MNGNSYFQQKKERKGKIGRVFFFKEKKILKVLKFISLFHKLVRFFFVKGGFYSGAARRTPL